MIFGSHEWRDEAARILSELLARFGPVQSGRFTISERFDAVPPTGETIVWSAIFSPSGLEFATDDLPDADFYLRGSHDDLLPIASIVLGEGAENQRLYGARRQQLIDSGAVVFSGDLSSAPHPVARVLLEFHDHMARAIA